jgi:Ca-activated chloride channel family protein
MREVEMKRNGQPRVRVLIVTLLLILISQLPVFADGLIIIREPVPTLSPFPLEVRYHHVDVKINGNIASTYIDQEFYNPTNMNLEGYYIFPIPKGAVINEFSMEINGEEVFAELLDAAKARKIYEDIVRRMKDPALLEYTDQGFFKVRIFPIEPRSTKKVSISYREILNSDNGMYEYLYPLNTEKFSAKPLKDVRIKVDLKTNNEIKNIYSPTHPIDVVHKDNHNATISYEEENIKPNIDFKLYYHTNNDDVGLSLLTYQSTGEDGYFFLTASPSFIVDADQIDSKDITFVLDVSGSMAGKKMRQAKQALLYCVSKLNRGDGFDIIKFSTEAYSLFGKIEDANETNIKRAEKFIENLKPVGGTNIDDALSLALKEINNSSRTHMIIFITDGKPTIGETNDDVLIKKLENSNKTDTRIFTFGIGNEINTHLLDKITEVTRATRSYITPDEDIEVKISNFYDKVQSPVLTNLSLSFGGVRTFQTYPNNLPDLFRGSSLTIFGRYNIPGRHGGTINPTIILKGTVNGEAKEYSITLEIETDNTDYDFIPPLWASRRIGYLLDQIRLNGSDEELVDEVTQLAREFGIVTPYTSYLIMEDEEIRLRRNDLVDDFQTMPEMPEAKREYEGDYEAMKDKSGGRSVVVSEEFRKLNEAKNQAETQQGSSRMGYVDEFGYEQNLSQQVKNVQGRAFYQNSKFWVDSELQKQNAKNKNRIQFNSEEYYKLLNEKPETSQFLALGQNVRFFYKDTFYEIYE